MLIFSTGNATYDDSSVDVIDFLFLGVYGWNYQQTRIRITTHSVLVPWSTMSST